MGRRMSKCAYNTLVNKACQFRAFLRLNFAMHICLLVPQMSLWSHNDDHCHYHDYHYHDHDHDHDHDHYYFEYEYDYIKG